MYILCKYVLQCVCDASSFVIHVNETWTATVT